MGLKATYGAELPVNYSKVKKNQFEVFDDTQKVYSDDQNFDYGNNIFGVESSTSAFASPQTKTFTLSNFKIKKLTLKMTALGGGGGVNNANIRVNGAYQLIDTQLAPLVGSYQYVDITENLYDTVIDGSINIVMTGTGVGAGISYSYILEGFQL